MNVETPIFIIVAVYDSDFKIFLLNKKTPSNVFQHYSDVCAEILYECAIKQ